MFAGNFAPAGWAFCWGQLMPISENDALFTLIGTTYGGDGQETFALPDLQGRVPMHQGASSIIGEKAGVESVTLTTSQMPAHSHALLASQDTADGSTIAGRMFGQVGATQVYREALPTAPFAANALGPAGGSQPHDNMQPYLGINFIISLFGIFPHT
ncbi:MAG TPA: tail fiber protein [Xanthomonadales bacterium]|nr:tail fiber protein [Xanthomonadales bacterium]